MTDSMNTTAPEAGAIILSAHDANRLDAGLGYMSDALAALLDQPDQDDRLTIGTLGLVHVAVGEMLGIIDGWNRRGPEPVPEGTERARRMRQWMVEDIQKFYGVDMSETARRLNERDEAKAEPAGNVSSDRLEAFMHIGDARSEAEDTVKLIEAATNEMSDIVGAAALDKAYELALGIADRMRSVERLLGCPTKADEGAATVQGGQRHA